MLALPVRQLSAPFRFRLWNPRHLRLIMSDLSQPAAQPQRDDRLHLEAAIDWLCRAQDARDRFRDKGGVSAGWSFEDGWLPGYPETTGYIIETFLTAARILGRPELTDRANRMIDWELSLQDKDGAFPGHHGEPGSHPVIFNVGQIMHGMMAGYLELGRKECLESAVRAGHWMARQQDPDGCWRRFEHNDVPHVYNTRATWAMVRAGLVSGEKAITDGAIRNLDWALSQQRQTGWFATNAFTTNADPFTHTIAYAIRGFLESGLLLGDQKYVDAAIKAAEAMAAQQRPDGSVAGTYADGWRPSASYVCVTGVAQMSLCWLRMAQRCGRQDMRAPAHRGIDYVKKTQRLTDPDPEVAGAIPGSAPIWGAYARFEFPNWATKFFADAVMMRDPGVAIPPDGDR
jgi:hypothetical protein